MNIPELEITKKLVDKYYKGIGVVTKSCRCYLYSEF